MRRRSAASHRPQTLIKPQTNPSRGAPPCAACQNKARTPRCKSATTPAATNKPRAHLRRHVFAERTRTIMPAAADGTPSTARACCLHQLRMVERSSILRTVFRLTEIEGAQYSLPWQQCTISRSQPPLSASVRCIQTRRDGNLFETLRQ
jgi:hypothetical protein